MKNYWFLVPLLLVLGIGVSTALAETIWNTGNFNNIGFFTVRNGSVTVQNDQGGSAIGVQNGIGASNAIKFWDIDDNQIFQFRQPNHGQNLDIIDITNNKIALSVKAGNGNVAIGHANPTEELDVNGDIKLSGNILSNGDICIGTCS
jgi:hypothetical protein